MEQQRDGEERKAAAVVAVRSMASVVAVGSIPSIGSISRVHSVRQVELAGVAGKDVNEVAPPERLYVTVLLLVTSTSFLGESIILPFLPGHVTRMGLSVMWSSIVFSTLPVTVILASFATSNIMTCWGRPRALIIGVTLQGLATVVFGCADALTGGTQAAVFVYMMCRVVIGFGTALASTSAFALAAERLPESFGRIMGFNEMAAGAGFSIGPVLGSFLYQARGFMLPFLVVGACFLCIVLPSAILLKRAEETVASAAFAGNASEEEEGASMLQDLSCGVIVPLAALFVGCFFLGMCEGNLEPYLIEVIQVSHTDAGIIIGVFAAFYAGCGPVAGMIGERCGALPVLAVGTAVCGLISAVAFSPVIEAIPVPSTGRTVYVVTTLILIGIASAFAAVPALPAMKEGLVKITVTSMDNLAALFNISMQLGMACGPVVGTALIQALNFERACMGIGLVTLAYGLYSSHFAWTHHSGKDLKNSDSEQTV